jgi:hypothetical protein
VLKNTNYSIAPADIKTEIEKLGHPLDLPIPSFTNADIQAVINHLKPKISPGYDLITGKILKELPNGKLHKSSLS